MNALICCLRHCPRTHLAVTQINVYVLLITSLCLKDIYARMRWQYRLRHSASFDHWFGRFCLFALQLKLHRKPRTCLISKESPVIIKNKGHRKCKLTLANMMQVSLLHICNTIFENLNKIVVNLMRWSLVGRSLKSSLHSFHNIQP